MISRPMLAKKLKQLTDAPLPILGTPKYDGLRCVTYDHQALTRSFKRVANYYAQRLVSTLPDGLDGELVCGDFNEGSGLIRRHDGQPDFRYCVFDYCPDLQNFLPYAQRVKLLHELELPDFVVRVQPRELVDVADLERYEDECLEDGFEGVVLRVPDAPYVCARSKLMLKYKRVQDSEAMILSLNEARRNDNPIVRNQWGYVRRPGGSEGKVPKDTLGSMVVLDVHTGVLFEIGTGKGLTAELRQKMWLTPQDYIGRIVRYSYQAAGMQDRPRFPSFQGFREPEDMDASYECIARATIAPHTTCT